MPTENQRVVAYADAALYERLKQYQEEKGFKSLSGAVAQALNEFFREADIKASASAENEAIAAINQELAAVRERVDQLSEIVQRLDQESQLRE